MGAREPFIFGKGWVHTRDLIYLYGATRAMNEEDSFETVVLRKSGEEWGLWQVPTRLCSVVTAGHGGKRTVFCTGIDGYVEVSDSVGVHSEPMEDSDDGPNDLKHIAYARPVGGRMVAVGMSRMVYVRDIDKGPWQRIDGGVRVSRQSLDIDGLKAIDGDGRGNYIAVGLHGNIWLCEAGRWREVETPTNVTLETVRWIGDAVYIAGGGGLLMRGTPEALEIVDHTGAQETFWSIEWFRGELYLATGRSVWVLRGDDLEQIQVAPTTGWLHANDDVLLSVGARDPMLYDGSRWKRLDPPPPEVDWPFEW